MSDAPSCPQPLAGRLLSRDNHPVAPSGAIGGDPRAQAAPGELSSAELGARAAFGARLRSRLEQERVLCLELHGDSAGDSELGNPSDSW